MSTSRWDIHDRNFALAVGVNWMLLLSLGVILFLNLRYFQLVLEMTALLAWLVMTAVEPPAFAFARDKE